MQTAQGPGSSRNVLKNPFCPRRDCVVWQIWQRCEGLNGSHMLKSSMTRVILLGHSEPHKVGQCKLCTLVPGHQWWT